MKKKILFLVFGIMMVNVINSTNSIEAVEVDSEYKFQGALTWVYTYELIAEGWAIGGSLSSNPAYVETSYPLDYNIVAKRIYFSITYNNWVAIGRPETLTGWVYLTDGSSHKFIVYLYEP